MPRAIDPTDVGQLRAWASSLGRTHEQRVRVIRDLLVHAKSDEMSPTDLGFVRAAFALLASSPSWSSSDAVHGGRHGGGLASETASLPNLTTSRRAS
jgi:hypothetical protein